MLTIFGPEVVGLRFTGDQKSAPILGDKRMTPTPTIVSPTTFPAAGMSTPLNPTIAEISQQVLTWAPIAQVAVIAAEQSSADGETKTQAVVDGVVAVGSILSGSPNPNVAIISALAVMFVSIFNKTGLFHHKAKTS